MSRIVDLSLLTERQKEDMLLTWHSALSRIMGLIRDRLPMENRLRREIEEVVESAVDRRPFVAALARSNGEQLARDRARRYADRWVEWQEEVEA
ncbi:MAG: hypothetical protein ACYDFT_00335 [Thermoplasmata archaeon]